RVDEMPTSNPMILKQNLIKPHYAYSFRSRSRYSNLKKLIYQIERDIISTSLSAQGDTEASGNATEESLLLGAKSRANTIFIPALDKELDKVIAFYVNKERELFAEVAQLLSQVEWIQNLENSHQYARSF